MRNAVLNWIADLVWRRPWLVVIAAATLAVIAAVYASLELRLNADTDDLISPSRPFMKDYRRYLDEFDDLEFINIVIAKNGDGQRAEAAVDALAQRLRQIERLPAVHHAVEPAEQLRIATRAMSDEELASLVMVSEAFPSILSAAGAADVMRDANAQLGQLLTRGVAMTPEEQQRAGAAAIFLLNAVAAAREDSPSREAMEQLLGDQLKREYLISDSGQLYFINIVPEKDFGTLAIIEQPLRDIRQAVDEIRAQFPDLEIGVTGKPVLQADELATSNQDMSRAAVIAFFIVSGLFMIIIGGIWRPALSGVAFLFAGAWTYGAATLLVGQLNLFSIIFALVLVGVGFDFAIHLITRYNEHRTQHSVRDSIRHALLTTGCGNLTSATTTCAVFLTGLFTSFQGLRELGLIAAMGLLFCLTSMTLVLPAMLVLLDRRTERREAPILPPAETLPLDAPHPPRLTGIWNWSITQPGMAIMIVLLGTGGLFAASGRLRFEDNILNLQATGLESVEWEHRVLADSVSASWFGAVIVDDLNELAELVERARQQNTIGRVRSVLDIIQLPTPQREEARQQLHAPLARSTSMTSVKADAADNLHADDLRTAAASLAILATAAAQQASQDDIRQLRNLANDLKALADLLEDPSQAEALRIRMDRTIAAIADSLRLMLEGDQLPLRDALPAAVRSMCMSTQGNFLLAMHPNRDVWELEPMGQFVAGLRAVSPHATGAPIAHYESLLDMKRAFMQMAVLAFFVVALLVWLDFRSIFDTLLTMLPLVIGTIWLIETMALLDVSFNLANFFSVPILLGVGVDSAIHIMHRYREGGPARLSLGSTRKAVVLTAATTMIGFGCLMLARHRGLFSLGVVMAIGSIACLLACLLVLPALLALYERRLRRSGNTADAISD